MATRRGRSMDREGDRLTEGLERLACRPMLPAHAPQFKAPQYNGQGYVEYFISRFEEISDANGWEDAAALLHLREALKRMRKAAVEHPLYWQYMLHSGLVLVSLPEKPDHG